MNKLVNIESNFSENITERHHKDMDKVKVVV
jgi:hypothetical protein